MQMNIAKEQLLVLVNEHDVQAMGEALIRLAEDRVLREKMGNAARRHMSVQCYLMAEN